MDELTIRLQALSEIDKQIEETDDYAKLEMIFQELTLRVMTVESKKNQVWKVA